MRWPRGQRGQALPLVLIFLTVGTLMITPALTYTGTGLNSQRISEEQLVEQDASDAAVMDAIWQIITQGVLDQVNETGAYEYDFELGQDKWEVDIEIPSFGTSDWQDIPPNMACKIEVRPNWLEAQGVGTFYYIFRLDMPQWSGSFSFALPVGLTYNDGATVHVGPESQSSIDPDAEVDHENSQYWRLRPKPARWTDLTNIGIVEVDEVPETPAPDTSYVVRQWVTDDRPWTSMTSGATEKLNGIWGSSASDVFAVGDSGNIIHYDGSNWTSMTSGTTEHLFDVWGTASDVFAVGSWGTILHYDGNSWTSMTSGTTEKLNGIWGSSSSDVFAVGSGGTILNYTNSTWNPMTSGTTGDLYGIWGSSSSDVFAVGMEGTVLHYDDSNWTSMTSGTTDYIGDVWGSSSSDVFAVGRNGTIIHYDGSNWSSMSSGTGQILSDVWGRSSSDVFAVGWDSTIRHYDGSSWSSMNSGTTEHLEGVWVSPSTGDVFGAGYFGTLRHYCCRHKLTFVPDFTAATGEGTYIMVFQATGSLGWGLHAIIPVFQEGGTPTELGATATIASAVYNIIIDAGDYTISAVIGFTADGEVVLISYQVIS